jgi:hypothetical protein
MKNVLLLILIMLAAACEDGGDPYIGSGTPPTESVKRIGGFTALNGHSVSGQLEIVNILSDNTNVFRTRPDFSITTTLNKVSFYLTDSIGTIDLQASSQKTKIGDLFGNFPGTHEFSIGSSYTNYNYAVVRNDSINENMAQAKLVLPQIPDLSK